MKQKESEKKERKKKSELSSHRLGKKKSKTGANTKELYTKHLQATITGTWPLNRFWNSDDTKLSTMIYILTLLENLYILALDLVLDQALVMISLQYRFCQVD